MNAILVCVVYVRNVNILRKEKKKSVKAKIIYPRFFLSIFRLFPLNIDPFPFYTQENYLYLYQSDILVSFFLRFLCLSIKEKEDFLKK
jgi:hypothetical protein